MSGVVKLLPQSGSFVNDVIEVMPYFLQIVGIILQHCPDHVMDDMLRFHDAISVKIGMNAGSTRGADRFCRAKYC